MGEATWQRLEVALVQVGSGLDATANRSRLAELAPQDADLVVFPEAMQCDFPPVDVDWSPYAESLDGPFVAEVRRVATEVDAAVLAGMFEATASGPPYNSLVVSDGGGEPVRYRKIHLYDSFGYRESDRLAAGPLEPVVVEVAGVRVGLMTCYDLRFPELARALVEAGAEVLVVAAAWVAGEGKVEHWRTLLRARAIENTVYVVACGQPAPRYCGHSLVVDPLGVILAETGAGETGGVEVVRASLTRARLDEARALNPSLLNRRM